MKLQASTLALGLFISLLFVVPSAGADSAAAEREALRQHIESLEQELQRARDRLAEMEPPVAVKERPVRIGGPWASTTPTAITRMTAPSPGATRTSETWTSTSSA